MQPTNKLRWMDVRAVNADSWLTSFQNVSLNEFPSAIVSARDHWLHFAWMLGTISKLANLCLSALVPGAPFDYPSVCLSCNLFLYLIRGHADIPRLKQSAQVQTDFVGSAGAVYTTWKWSMCNKVDV